jgi:hypothetical protein
MKPYTNHYANPLHWMTLKGRTGQNSTGGMVRNISWDDITIISPRHAVVYIDVYGGNAPPPLQRIAHPAVMGPTTTGSPHKTSRTATSRQR